MLQVELECRRSAAGPLPCRGPGWRCGSADAQGPHWRLSEAGETPSGGVSAQSWSVSCLALSAGPERADLEHQGRAKESVFDKRPERAAHLQQAASALRGVGGELPPPRCGRPSAGTPAGFDQEEGKCHNSVAWSGLSWSWRPGAGRLPHTSALGLSLAGRPGWAVYLPCVFVSHILRPRSGGRGAPLVREGLPAPHQFPWLM